MKFLIFLFVLLSYVMSRKLRFKPPQIIRQKINLNYYKTFGFCNLRLEGSNEEYRFNAVEYADKHLGLIFRIYKLGDPVSENSFRKIHDNKFVSVDQKYFYIQFDWKDVISCDHKKKNEGSETVGDHTVQKVLNLQLGLNEFEMNCYNKMAIFDLNKFDPKVDPRTVSQIKFTQQFVDSCKEKYLDIKKKK